VPEPLQRAFLWWSNPRFVAGVVGVLTDEQGRVLLLRHDYRRQGQWGLPGGWVKAHESLPAALARELREETGLEVEVGPVLAVLRGTDMRRLDVIYRCRAVSGELKLGHEIGDAGYFALDELPPGMYPEQVELLRRAIRGAS
jgi:8-oxo-dGTP diphosphatase